MDSERKTEFIEALATLGFQEEYKGTFSWRSPNSRKIEITIDDFAIGPVSIETMLNNSASNLSYLQATLWIMKVMNEILLEEKIAEAFKAHHETYEHEYRSEY